MSQNVFVKSFKITWARNNRLIDPDHDSVVFLNNNQTIWINTAREGLDGRYTCTATNKNGQASRDFIIKLTGKLFKMLLIKATFQYYLE